MSSLVKFQFSRLLLVLVAIAICYSTYKLGQGSAGNQEVISSRETLEATNAPPPFSIENVEVISWEPRVFHFHGFITHEMCDHIIELGKDKLERSMVVGPGGKAVVNPARSSYGTFLSSFMGDPVIQEVERRIEKWTFLPKENGEVFYLLRYNNGEEYKAHTDWFHSDSGAAYLGRSGQRVATVLTYLSDVDEGGETFFPRINKEIRPKKGDAVMFWNVTPDHSNDDMALHGSKPVTKGVKWSMTRWIRERKA